MIFRSAYNNDIIPEVTPAGEKLEQDYQYDKHGTLVKAGKTNVYEKVQEHLEDSKIENILKRVTAGDTSVLRPDGIYEDISEIPKDFITRDNFMKEMTDVASALATEQAQKTQAETAGVHETPNNNAGVPATPAEGKGGTEE